MPTKRLQCFPVAGANGISATGGSTDWVNIGNIIALDGFYATTVGSISSGTQSDRIDMVGLQPTQPGWLSYISNNTITGLFLIVNRRAGTAGILSDYTVQRLASGSPIGNNIAKTDTWGAPYPYFTEVSYGGGVDIWGSLPTAADIRNGTFGMGFAAQATGGSTTANIDAIQVYIEVTIPDAPEAIKPGTPQADISSAAPELLQRQGLIADLKARLRAFHQRPILLKWLAALYPWDEDLGIEVPVYLSGTNTIDGHFSEVGDPVEGVFWEPRLIQPFRFTYTLTGQSRLIGGAAVSSGEAVIDNGDHEFDGWNDLIFDGRPAKIWLGLEIPGPPSVQMKMRDFTRVFDGYSEGVELGRQIRVTLVDRSRLLTGSCTPQTYAGTGGLEGGANQAGTVKPGLIGVGSNISPRGIDGTNYIFQVAGYFPIKAVTTLYVDGVVTGAGFTTDLYTGRIDFTVAPTGTVTVDAMGWQAQNNVKDSRDGTQATWTKTNCSAGATAGVGSGNGTKVTASAGNATIAPSWNGTLNTLAASWVFSVYARRVSGVGDVKLFGQSAAITLTDEWQRYYMVQNSSSSPALANDAQEILIVTSGDVIEFDHYQVEPGTLRPSPPIVTGTTVVTNYPSTPGGAIYFLATAFAGLVPYIDFDEDAFTAVAAKNADTIGRYIGDQVTALQVIDEICAAASLFARFTRDGRFTIGRFGVPDSGPIARLSEVELSRDQPPRRLRSFPRASKVRVRYARNETIQVDVATTVSLERKDAVAREWRDVVVLDDTAAALFGSAADSSITLGPNDIDMPTLLTDLTQATEFGRAILAQNSVRRQLVALADVSLTGLDLEPGDAIRISAVPITQRQAEADVGIINTLDHIVVSSTIDARNQTVTMETWGS